MSAPANGDTNGAGPSNTRREPREETLRIVEYTGFPRGFGEAPVRIGFTRDLSASGMCIGVDAAEQIGALLRVTVRDLDGSPDRVEVARVAWCSPTRDRRHWMGLTTVGAHAANDSGALRV